MAAAAETTVITSRSLEQWRSERCAHLDDLEAAHAAVGWAGSGRPHATQQLSFAYAMMLSSQFQGFCRDLHTEAAQHFCNSAIAQHPEVAEVLMARLLDGRKLDQGNPNPGNIGSDFGRFGVRFWALAETSDAGVAAAKAAMDELALWRNAIAHNDFSDARLGGKSAITLEDVRAWRRQCDLLADALTPSCAIFWYTGGVPVRGTGGSCAGGDDNSGAALPNRRTRAAAQYLPVDRCRNC